jgi:hypothetical protein
MPAPRNWLQIGACIATSAVVHTAAAAAAGPLWNEF